MATGRFTVKSTDTSLSELTASRALREIEKLKTFSLAATVYDRDGSVVSTSYLEAMAKIASKDN